MMEGTVKIDRFRLKANASFAIREGWLTKGLRHVAEDPEVFLDETAAMGKLGVGSAMVKSIRYWMQAAGLTTEKKSGRRTQTLTELGQAILNNDRYFEDDFTLCLIHCNLVSDPAMATVWYLLFNCYQPTRFTREDMTETLLQTFRELTEKDFAVSSFRDDCATVLKTYVSDDVRQLSPEDNMQCPLAALNLFTKTTRNIYECTMPPPSKLHALAVLYVMLRQMQGRESISLDRLISEPCGVGKVFHLTPYRINAYLDELQAAGYLRIQRTAGLNMIYPSPGLTPMGIVQEYYRK